MGLAPGLRGANRTGRPFTGDFAGDLLYSTLIRHGFATGTFAARPDDGLQLQNTCITNAVRCVPPQNKPLPAEMHACRPFLAANIASLPHLAAIVALGRVAHESVLRAFGQPLSRHPFTHGGQHGMALSADQEVRLFDSYHCSRYNTNTGVLTPAMFDAVFAGVAAHLQG